MENRQKKGSGSLGFTIAATAVVVVAAGGGMTWWAFKSLFAPDKPSIPVAVTPKQLSLENNDKSELMQGSIYWLDPEAREVKLVPSPITVEKSADKQNIIASAFQRLLAGSGDGTYTTTIPEGTKLLGVKLESNGVHVNLSAKFKEGGGSTSMVGRLGQIIYTATSLNPEDPVWLNVDGKPLEVLGGEGMIVEQPITRKNFEENFLF